MIGHPVPFLVPILSSANVKGATEKLIPDIPSTKPKESGGETKPAAELSSYGFQSVAACQLPFSGRQGASVGGCGVL